MKKIAVILTQAVESNTSAMIRCKSIISALNKNGNNVTCFCPYSNENSMYYECFHFEGETIDVRRYGKKGTIKDNYNELIKKKTIKSYLIGAAYKLFKKFDVFGVSLQYLKYKKDLCESLCNEQFDILITFSDPMTAHMIGIYCKKHLDIKYIQQWGDPLTLDTIGKTSLPRVLRYFIERKLLRPADRICYVSPFTNEEQKMLFKSKADNMVFLPTPCISYPNLAKKKDDKIKIGYFGSYNSIARDIRPLYEAACKLDRFEFVFIGNSDIKLETKKNIKVIDRLTSAELEEFIEETDVLVCLMNSKGNQIPGKMYHYAGSEKEILILKDGEFGDRIEEFFAQYSRYSFVDNNANDIEQAIKNYQIKGIPKRAPLQSFKAEIIAERLIRDI